MQDKLCKRCNETKSIENFGKDAKAKDGLKSWCRPCFTSYQRERRHTPPPTVPIIPEPITHKNCSCCKMTKEVGMFGGNIQTHDRYKAWCRECNTTYMKQYRNSHPELREKERIYARNYNKNIIQSENIISVN